MGRVVESWVAPTSWAALAESVSDLVLVVDAEGTILYINRTEGGVPRHRVVGSCALDYVPPALRAELARSLLGVFTGGHQHVHDVPTTFPDGTRRWYTTHTTAFVRDGETVAATIIAHDVTDRYASPRAMRECEARIRALTALAGGTAHDFNNVLAAILMSAGSMRDLIPADHPVAPAVAAITEATHRGTVLTDRLLTVVRRGERSQAGEFSTV